MPDALPERIGSYLIRGVIGTGSMGVVYLGHDPVINRAVAIKTIQRHLLEAGARQHSAAARFRVEAQAAGRLNHRNIVSVYQFGEDADCAYIVMEYVRGHSLIEYLRRPERLAKDEVLCLMLQVLDALHYAHGCGVVHRDIKPANLMVDHGGWVKITDFGIARTESSQVTRVNTVVGSPGYMAPEQYTGGPVDRRVDVFSAGVLLYQMLTGSVPFTGTDEAVMYQIVYGQHEPLAQRTGDPTLAVYDAVLDAALAKVPDQRYATALEFRDALKAVAGHPIAPRLAVHRLLALPADDAPTVALGAGAPAAPGMSAAPGSGAASAPMAAPATQPTPASGSLPASGSGSGSGSTPGSASGSIPTAPPAFHPTSPPAFHVPTHPASAPGSIPAAAASPSIPASAPTWPSGPTQGPTVIPPGFGAMGGAGSGAGSGADRPTSMPMPAGWDEAVLAGLERELTIHVGPMAKVLVRRAARGQTDLAVVRRLVASAIVDPGVRERFLARAAGSGAKAGGTSAPAGPVSSFPDTRPTGPREGLRLRPEDVDKASAVLARSLGPIGKVLAKRCADGMPTREQFVARVLEQLAARVDAKGLEAELWRSLG